MNHRIQAAKKMNFNDFFKELKNLSKKIKFYEDKHGYIRDSKGCCPIVAVVREIIPPLSAVYNANANFLGKRYLGLSSRALRAIISSADRPGEYHRSRMQKACGINQ